MSLEKIRLKFVLQRYCVQYDTDFRLDLLVI